MREEVGAREMGEDEVDSFKSEIYVGNTDVGCSRKQGFLV